ncbi:F0F1 ATP synthase subunit B [Chachezhania antarctica]|uniref:F0F1 ATP synthase subunit B n=1 Tax=Chachezhania antarctica TaxID=2340860 RepID=UPI000EB4F240|nr:F0F1 ATP synthase subunit B [Chachezhania antarctica]
MARALSTATATLGLGLLAGPALAATGPFFSLSNTNFIVLIAFLIFIGILLYVGVPKIVGNLLDKRAEGIKNELDEARALREEAQALLASFERKHAEVKGLADQIVKTAKEDAAATAEMSEQELKRSIERRLQSAQDQIASAEAAAIKEVRDQAIVISVEAAGKVLAKQMDAKDANKLIDDGIDTVGKKLH